MPALVRHSVELRCPGGHLHGTVRGRFIRRKCQQCSRQSGHDVFHIWDTETWTIVAEDAT